jgi:hypothetical protein
MAVAQTLIETNAATPDLDNACLMLTELCEWSCQMALVPVLPGWCPSHAQPMLLLISAALVAPAGSWVQLPKAKAGSQL